MNIDLQAKLLRVIENGEFIKLGDTKTTRVDVRIIAATNRDLERIIGLGEFREDLYYRLNVFAIKLPPLRDRVDDIPALANYFLSNYCTRENCSLSMNKETLGLLQRHHWKGNTRELRNVLERASILSEGQEIVPGNLPYDIQKQDLATKESLSLASVEKSDIQKVLEFMNGNKTKAAQALGIGLTTLYRKMEEYHLPK